MKFYEIDARLRELYESAINEETGEISPDLEWEIERLELEREYKIEGCGIVYKELLAEAEGIANEIKALTERKRVAANKAERLKLFLTSQLKEDEKLKTDRLAISWRASERVEIDPLQADVLEDCYVRIKREPDKTAIKAAIKSGAIIDGVTLVKSKNIQIK